MAVSRSSKAVPAEPAKDDADTTKTTAPVEPAKDDAEPTVKQAEVKALEEDRAARADDGWGESAVDGANIVQPDQALDGMPVAPGTEETKMVVDPHSGAIVSVPADYDEDAEKNTKGSDAA